MTVTEHELEEAAKAPRVTQEQVRASVKAEYVFSAATAAYSAGYRNLPPDEVQNLSVLTFVVLVLNNGYTVTGQSACADPKNFNKDIGHRLAREDAFKKLWPLLGYELRTTLHEAEKVFSK